MIRQPATRQPAPAYLQRVRRGLLLGVQNAACDAASVAGLLRRTWEKHPSAHPDSRALELGVRDYSGTKTIFFNEIHRKDINIPGVKEVAPTPSQRPAHGLCGGVTSMESMDTSVEQCCFWSVFGAPATPPAHLSHLEQPGVQNRAALTGHWKPSRDATSLESRN